MRYRRGGGGLQTNREGEWTHGRRKDGRAGTRAGFQHAPGRPANIEFKTALLQDLYEHVLAGVQEPNGAFGVTGPEICGGMVRARMGDDPSCPAILSITRLF